MELDCDRAISSIKLFLTNKEYILQEIDIAAITYNIIYLVQNEEYSVREYAEHAIGEILSRLKNQH